LIVCIAEDRMGFGPPIKLLILSITKHCPALKIILIFPPADEDFVAWLSQYPQVTLRTQPLPTAYGVNVKPQAILYLLDEAHEEILWIDSDIIVTRDMAESLAGLDERTLVITEEALWTPYRDPDGMRARMWGFKVGRVFPFTLNTGVLRATNSHYSLMTKWRELLESEEYRSAQRQDWRSRPLHMVSDQDVLTALLASEEFADIPVEILLRGRDIVQFFGPYGYTLRERLIHMTGRQPSFIHAQGPKPWLRASNKTPSRTPKNYLYDLYLDLSPYTLTASRFQRELSEPSPWMQAHSFAALALRAMGFWYAPLVGLPIAALADLVRLAKQLIGAILVASVRDERQKRGVQKAGSAASCNPMQGALACGIGLILAQALRWARVWRKP
jgi:hypothetical protein